MTPSVQQSTQHNQHQSVHATDNNSNNNNNDDGEFFHFHTAASTSNQKIHLNMADIENKLRDAPDKYLLFVAHYLAGHINDTDGIDHLNGPILKSSIKSIYWIFITQYAVLALLGIIMNLAILAYIGYHRLFRDTTHAFIANLALCHIVQCAIVLPITLMVMLIQNWIFGQFLCFFLPMLQDIPLHVAMITHILIAWDRMRWLNDPLKCRIPAFVCCCATWLTGMVIALPFPIYTIYVEIGDYLPRLQGVGLCVVNLMDDMHEYMRGLFFLMYCAPSLLLAYIYVKTSQELRPPVGPIAEYRAEIRMRQRNSSSTSMERSYSNATTAIMGPIKMPTYSTGSATRTYDLHNAELDLCREKRNQRAYGSMAAAQVFSICPLMVLRFVRLSLEETYENQKHFDFTYLMLVWLAFLPTIIFPYIYGTQILPKIARQRLRDYFHLSIKCLAKKRHNEIDESTLARSRENSIEKDGSTNISQRTSIILNGDNNPSGLCDTERDAITEKLNEAKKTTSLVPYNKDVNRLKQKFKQEEKAKDIGHFSNPLVVKCDKEKVETSSKRLTIKNNNVSVPSLSNASNNHDKKLQTLQGVSKHSVNYHNKTNRTENGDAGCNQQKVNFDSLDNWSFSNTTTSTYCNGTESYYNDDVDVDAEADADANKFGDGDSSSIISSAFITDPISGSSMALPPYRDNKKLSYRDYSDFSNYSCMNSTNTIPNDMDMIDLLECKRNSIDKDTRERRRLPNIEKFCYRSSNSIKSPLTTVSTLSAKIPVANINGPLKQQREALSTKPTLSKAFSSESKHLISRSTKSSFDEEMPSDFYDDCKKEKDQITYTTKENTIVVSPVEQQYQYYRRSNRKFLQRNINGTNSCHRFSKRESFNSLQNNDLIAGAFGELDPTQPLTKMSVIENRVMLRRNSGASGRIGGNNGHNGRSSTSFLATGRSSLKSRDFDQSLHSTQPELDFRENIFAEL